MSQLKLNLEALRLPLDPFDAIPNGGTLWIVIHLPHAGLPCSHGEMNSCKRPARYAIGKYTKSKLGTLETRWTWQECDRHALARARKHDLVLPAKGEKWERGPT